jgi:hypothetical protein
MLVYLDAATPSDGQALVDLFGAGGRQALVERAEREGDGWQLPPGPVPADRPPELAEWARPRRAPQPLQTFLQPLALAGGETALPRAFVYCARGKAADSPQALRAAALRADPRWRFRELETDHDLHYSAPDETVRILRELAGQ